MNKIIRPEFWFEPPKKLDARVLYIQKIKGKTTTLHLCPCGCDTHIKLEMKKGGYYLTLSEDKKVIVRIVPSIKTPCGAHYWIKDNLMVTA